MSTIRDAFLDPATTRGQVLRFVFVGGANTVCTTIAFYVLALFIPVRLAFTVVYVAGLIFVVAITPHVVFGSHASVARRVLLALWYVLTYLVGIGVISLLTSVGDPSRAVTVLATVLVTAPLSFVGARVLLGRRS